jgi:hypothetical protein
MTTIHAFFTHRTSAAANESVAPKTTMAEPTITNVAKWKGNRREIGEDFFETPESAILPIRPYIPEGVTTILECTYGKGAIGKVLERWGYKVIKRDLYPKTDDTTKADFLTDELPECDMLVFNPPFSLKTQFLKRACESGKPFLFICPITIMETQTRFNLFKEHELSVLNLPNRTNYVSGKGKKVWFHSVWIVKHPEFKNQVLYAEME